MYFASACQYRFQIIPDIFLFSCLKCPPLSRSSVTDTIQLSTVWALAGVGPSFHFKVAVITNKNHSLHAPIQCTGSPAGRLQLFPLL